jgi:hypothetical protein
MVAVDSNGYNLLSPGMVRAMSGPRKLQKESYTEVEAAEALGVSIARLHLLLDENIFNDGTRRPGNLTFRSSDLVLLGFWHRTSPNPKVVCMPRPNCCARTGAAPAPIRSDKPSGRA